MNIIPSTQYLALDDMETRTTGIAFDLACELVGGFGIGLMVRRMIAMQIIDAAKAGERNPARLCQVALQKLGRRLNADTGSSVTDTPPLSPQSLYAAIAPSAVRSLAGPPAG